MSRFVSVESVRLDLSGGDWIEIKDELSYGDMQATASKTRGDFTAGALFMVASALLDWSFTDAQGKRVPIETDAAKLSALKALTNKDFSEVEEAISKHYEKAAAEKKAKAPRGSRKSGRTSASAA